MDSGHEKKGMFPKFEPIDYTAFALIGVALALSLYLIAIVVW